MERELEEKFDAIMGKPGVIGVVCADKRGLCLSDGDRRRSTSPNLIELETSDSSDEDEMVGNNPRPKAARVLPPKENLLSGSVQSASFNIMFQVLIRVFTFGLNAFILRYVSHGVLGICNVRLALLYSSILFLSREPFRRASLKMSHESPDSWTKAITLIWFAVPNTILWSLILGSVWCFVLSQPTESELAVQYSISVIFICLATIVDSMAEVPYIVAQYYLFYKVRIVGETLLIVVRSSFLCVAVLFYPQLSVVGYALGAVGGTATACLMYYTFFYIQLKRGDTELPFESIQELLPNQKWEISSEMKSYTWTFYKQGVLKQLLTEGERYLMTFFDILTFQEQGIYDLVSNLGSLAARFIFLPIEESSYYYFAQTLKRRCSFKRREQEMAEQASYVLSNLVRLMTTIGLTILVFGIPYSQTLLFLYGGKSLSDEGPATVLLQANCVYIFIMAVNGVTEAFTFAAMTQEQMNAFNQKLVLFSVVFLLCSYMATSLFGSLGFYVANSLNMTLRVGHSVYLIRSVFYNVPLNPFAHWFPKPPVAASFFLSFFWIMGIMVLANGRFLPIIFGLVTLATNVFVLLKYDRDLINFFVRLYKTKTV